MIRLKAVSDLAAVLIVSAAPLAGMVLIGAPWYLWSKRRRAKQGAAEQHIIMLLDWVDDMTTEQRMQHLQQRVRNRKRERQVIH